MSVQAGPAAFSSSATIASASDRAAKTQPAQDFSLFLRQNESGEAEMAFAIEGVDCAACIDEIEDAVEELPAIARARLNYTSHRLTVMWARGEPANPPAVFQALAAAGYKAYPFEADRAEEIDRSTSRHLLRCLGVAGFAMMNIMLLSVSVWSGNATDITPETRDLFHWLSALIALPAAAYAGQPFFQSAIRALKARSLNMDVPITLGVMLALGVSVFETLNSAEHAYFDSAVMLLFFLLTGRYLDHAMRRRTRTEAGNLAALKATSANRIEPDGSLVIVPAAAIIPDDIVLVRAGERAPVDGVVVSGTASVDESLITGETLPQAISAGGEIHAGSLVHDGVLHVRTTAAGENTFIVEIERLLDKAASARGTYVRLADRAARMYAPIVHTTALLSFIGWLLLGASVHYAILIAVAVLIITCPCALALAVPAVQVVSAGALMRGGVLLNTGDVFERLALADTVVFDKTGTLTIPELKLDNARQVEPELLDIAARLAAGSTHPLARAIAASRPGIAPPEGVSEVPGAGIEVMLDGLPARLGSPTFCGCEDLAAAASAPDASVVALRVGERRAVLVIRQALRPDARVVVDQLRSWGKRVLILSGDRPEAVAPVARALGIEEWSGHATPADKIARLDQLAVEGRKVLMVGDGVNDAPSLAAASVSLSPITAADVTRAHADAVFLGEKLAPVATAIAVAAKARRLMRENLLIAVIYNFIAVPLAILGYVTPLVAALAMSGSSVIVTLNALRGRSVPNGAAPARQAHAPAPGLMEVYKA